ncbi:MAG: MmcQ/YjbR family DNA-binding protein [Chloroflexota bacterium]
MTADRPPVEPIDLASLPDPIRLAFERLMAAALAYPDAYEDRPWGDTVVKVRGKIFLFIGVGPDGLSLSTKLPRSADDVLALPFTQPTRYGLHRSGWVTSRFGRDDEPPVELLAAWLDESYRAVAPRRLLAANGLEPVARER